ncbi:YggS family pyridoxal phosphate-dependent enzyme [Legionella saoudiensis]|uniref:YggS family pyridoxal phosphate-dependent enzyme n=1 Tax=Legionella saoudiensis TaxID=1750561 RepID=UPI0007302308|nr:YggS family pyridoxal phosphate-dependent enzyme [Legionella saoudiensis]
MKLQSNLNQIQQLIKQAALESGRNENEVLLLAVSKQQSAKSIAQLFELGVKNFGENYFQEAHEKINALKELPICWHFIGPIQSNKAKNIARDFNWVHSINRLKIAQILNEHRPSNLPPLNVCLQVNLVPEETKSGISPEDVIELALAVSQLPHLKLRGLMTIPPPEHNPQKQYELFMQMTLLLKSLNIQLGLNMDTLSMGMSDDLVPAIKAGATIVRIGRAIFGERGK